MFGGRLSRVLAGAFAFCGVYSAALAETDFKRATAGDWSAIENAWRHKRELASQEVVYWASTSALAGRKVQMGIGSCGQYNVSFGIEFDREFKGPETSVDESKIAEDRIVYAKVLPSQRELSAVVVESGYVDFFSFDADAMVSGAKFMVCPAKDEGPRCLTFSLRGITAALKMVCPKR